MENHHREATRKTKMVKGQSRLASLQGWSLETESKSHSTRAKFKACHLVVIALVASLSVWSWFKMSPIFTLWHWLPKKETQGHPDTSRSDQRLQHGSRQLAEVSIWLIWNKKRKINQIACALAAIGHEPFWCLHVLTCFSDGTGIVPTSSLTLSTFSTPPTIPKAPSIPSTNPRGMARATVLKPTTGFPNPWK